MKSRKRNKRPSPPELIPIGTRLLCHTSGGACLTNNKVYHVMGHFRYWLPKYEIWEQFVTLKNDNGWTIKTNLNRFERLASLKMSV